ncbi:MAG: GntR family transcriptional regulator [Cellvibrio sp. 79]|nr:MAG: GntR family transcriptional regulator [Cellvibrio sp. 79]
MNWNDNQPIYRQLREKIVALILSGTFKEAEPLPSVRQVSSEYQINHITVSKAYQELVDMGVVEMRRGMGMYVLDGAQQKLHAIEREKFISTEVPALLARMRQLGMTKKELISALQAAQGE